MCVAVVRQVCQCEFMKSCARVCVGAVCEGGRGGSDVYYTFFDR